jgi:lipopolysaccharide heptosyltransferase I
MTREAPSILVVKLSSIGDVVQALPVAGALRRRFPDTHIAWAVGPAAADVVTGNPQLDEVLVIGGTGESGAEVRMLPPLASPLQLRRALHRTTYDIALDLQGLLKSALIARLSGARERVGYRTLREATCLFYNRRLVPDRRDIHAVESYLDFAEALGAEREPVEFDIAISDRDRGTVDELLEGENGFAALIPGARWESKLWPAERFAAVADALAGEFGITAVVLGAGRDSQLAAAVGQAASTRVIDLTGKTTLKQAAEVLRRCLVTIGNDTGPLYISAAMGTPTVAVFGPSDARRLGPYGNGHAKIVADVECAPCRNRRCRPRKCMEAIEPEEVIAAARALLRQNREACGGGISA